MTTTVLAYFPSPAQGVWYLGPVPIRAYALCIIAGIIVALMIGDRRWAARGGERGVIYDIALWAVPFGLIGGRLYHLATDWRTYFGDNGAGLAAALRIWEGGLGIWGAVAFGAVGAWIACRRRGIPLPAFGDAIAPGIVLAQAIGRLGNYFNQELYGRETTVPWGMEIFYRRDASGAVDVHSLDGVSTGQVAAVVHPTFLYELLWNVLVFLVLIYVDRKYRIGHGRLFALYVALYSVGRFWVELLRDDTATLVAGIRINVFTATFVFIGAVVYILLAPKGREDPSTLRGREAPEEPGEDLAEELADELVAVAGGTGLVAAATVAREHEGEDAAAVGDLGPAPEYLVTSADPVADADTDFVEQVESEEMAVEAQLEEELAEAAESGEGTGQEIVQESPATAASEASQASQASQASGTSEASRTSEASETSDEPAADEATAADEPGTTHEATAEEATPDETTAGSTASEDAERARESGEAAAEPESVPAAETNAEPNAEANADTGADTADTESGQESVIATSDGEPAPMPTAETADDEPTATRVSESIEESGVVTVTDPPDEESGEAASTAMITDSDAEAAVASGSDGQEKDPGFGTTLRRLLWGARSKD